MAPGFDLLLITDEAPALAERVARALAGAPPGRVALQLRHKGLSARALFALGEPLREITRRHGAALLVNDRVDVALALGADGVHLPAQGLPGHEARRLLGPDRWLGQSCHDEAELARAEREGVDYVTLAPVHAVPGKGAPLGISGLARLCQRTTLPVYALGGLGDQDVSAVRSAGARGMAVIRHVLGADEPGRRVAALCEKLCAESHFAG